MLVKACNYLTPDVIPSGFEAIHMPSDNDLTTNKATTARLKLTMPSPTHVANLEGLATPQRWEPNHRRPPYSPVTPTSPQVSSDPDARNRDHAELVIDEPEPIPISLEENSDAIALKAALSILQLQKQQTLRDIRQLDRMKAAANSEPEAFVEALKVGKLSQAPPLAVVDVNGDDEDDSDIEKPAKVSQGSEKPETEFGRFPSPQNVIRCPPINWAKYHVVGESLDKLHEEQRRRPEPGSPRRDEYGRLPEHVIAAPYRPFVDRLEHVPDSTTKEGKD